MKVKDSLPAPGLVLMALVGALACSGGSVEVGNPLTISLTVDRTVGTAAVDTFTFQYQATGTNLLGVVLEFGDGQADSLAGQGASSAGARRKHVYAEEGTYRAVARAEEAFGDEVSDTVLVEVRLP